MTEDARRKALAALTRLSDLAPDLRIGQLVAHLGLLSEDEGGHGLGEIEDAELVQIIDHHREELARLIRAPNPSLQIAVPE